ncbi:hypothetical protein LBK6_15045 [Leptospira borgpetersenii serovar Hardjo]|nr:hypothetical protein LBK6_15045 [Leptospira borgpetersenii serovar Hardjo]AWV71299.1 hypothetical protein B9T54_16125 [Leptospira borgpetersenii serovar Hardjo-bovis]AMX62816.1 hypothetical protein LBK9_14965 [Leptospira borgpetersenii serovar Hardjo]AMX66059.1 hypothetical protein LBK30_14970 [Leptospira borgpetersenii serovar Hardjo]AMX69291.1 hypothetical protein LBHA_14930 [Leptospira borgpetersenii serovar Hardjo]
MIESVYFRTRHKKSCLSSGRKVGVPTKSREFFICKKYDLNVSENPRFIAFSLVDGHPSLKELKIGLMHRSWHVI